MKKLIAVSAICVLVMVSSAFAAGDVIGCHNLSDNRGLVRVKSIKGNKMTVDAVYVSVSDRLVILSDMFADYYSQTQKAIYSEDRSCPDALEIKFQNSDKVVLKAVACADF